MLDAVAIIGSVLRADAVDGGVDAASSQSIFARVPIYMFIDVSENTRDCA